MADERFEAPKRADRARKQESAVACWLTEKTCFAESECVIVRFMDREDLKRRTKAFALKVMDLVDRLPRSIKGRCIADQLMRSATPVAANYRAACRARSRAEFVAKLAIVIEEADESLLWLQLISEGRVMLDEPLDGLIDEANQITAVMVATRKTACGVR